ncbi:hypothetical protein HK100_012466, partial [Physocladia obscura]
MLVVTATGLPSDERTAVEEACELIGAVFSPSLTNSTTHLIATPSAPISEKYRVAARLGIPIVCVEWLWAIQALKPNQLLSPASVAEFTHEHRIQPLSSLSICITGFDFETRSQVESIAKSLGASFEVDLSRICSHLIAKEPKGNKWEFAIKYGITVVSLDWIYACKESNEPELKPIDENANSSNNQKSVLKEKGKAATDVFSNANEVAMPKSPPTPIIPNRDAPATFRKKIPISISIPANTSDSYYETKSPTPKTSVDHKLQENPLITRAITTTTHVMPQSLRRSKSRKSLAINSTNVRRGEGSKTPPLHTKRKSTNKLSTARKSMVTEIFHKRKSCTALRRLTEQQQNTCSASASLSLFAEHAFIIAGFSAADTALLADEISLRDGAVVSTSSAHGASGRIVVMVCPLGEGIPRGVVVEDNVVVVSECWVERCVENAHLYRFSDSLLFRVDVGIGRKRFDSEPPVAGPDGQQYIVGITGVEGLDREQIRKLAEAMGAKFTEHLSSKNSHLIVNFEKEVAAEKPSVKLTRAKEWGITIVDVAWIFKCAEYGQLCWTIEDIPTPIDHEQTMNEDQEISVILARHNRASSRYSEVLNTNGNQNFLEILEVADKSTRIIESTVNTMNIEEICRNINIANSTESVSRGQQSEDKQEQQQKKQELELLQEENKLQLQKKPEQQILERRLQWQKHQKQPEEVMKKPESIPTAIEHKLSIISYHKNSKKENFNSVVENITTAETNQFDGTSPPKIVAKDFKTSENLDSPEVLNEDNICDQHTSQNSFAMNDKNSFTDPISDSWEFSDDEKFDEKKELLQVNMETETENKCLPTVTPLKVNKSDNIRELNRPGKPVFDLTGVLDSPVQNKMSLNVSINDLETSFAQSLAKANENLTKSRDVARQNAFLDVRICLSDRAIPYRHDTVEFCRALGATFLNAYNESCTHFVHVPNGNIGGADKDFRRVKNDIVSGRKVHIVSPAWLQVCAEKGRRICEDEMPWTVDLEKGFLKGVEGGAAANIASKSAGVGWTKSMLTSTKKAKHIFDEKSSVPPVSTQKESDKSGEDECRKNFNLQEINFAAVEQLISAKGNLTKGDYSSIGNLERRKSSSLIQSEDSMSVVALTSNGATSKFQFSDDTNHSLEEEIFTQLVPPKKDDIPERDPYAAVITYDDPTARSNKRQLIQSANTSVLKRAKTQDRDDSLEAFISSQNTRANTLYIFVLTGIDPAQKVVMKEQIEVLGGTVLEDFGISGGQTCTHLVCSKPVVIEKCLCACAKGAWMLQPDYIEKSSKSGRFLTEEDFEWALMPKIGAGTVGKAAKMWRQKLGNFKTGFRSHQAGAFDSWITLFVMKSEKKSQPFIRVLEAGSALVIPVLMAGMEDAMNKHKFTHCMTDMSKEEIAFEAKFEKLRKQDCVVANF